ncbi:hypothetical protein AB4Z29_24985 [Paenibacillus sp. 2TAB23]|uniref:hypothetical protein n=1 Tax=Paenibacillus sp. 2TAB23 TaxID=3233004 RepID=UPI003F9DC5BF
MAYVNEEQESVAVFDKISNCWDVYSCVQKQVTKLYKIATPYWEEKADGRVIAAKWKLNGNQVRFAMESVAKMSEEQKEASRQRMLDMHAKRASNVSE